MTRAAEIAASAGPIVAGAALTAHGSGALWWEAERLLIVADLHFEKGSALLRAAFPAALRHGGDAGAACRPRGALSSGGRRGVGHLPRPSRPVAHRARRRRGLARPGRRARRHLDRRQSRSRGGRRFRRSRCGMAGGPADFPPRAARRRRRARSPGICIRRRACRAGREHCADVVLLAMDAACNCRLSAPSPGLNIRDAAFDGLFGAQPVAHVLGRAAAHRVPLARCLPD